ncbi:hypothetical protein FHS55_003769 [Angulomicrobium tetraedrale]|uniref:Uncharacterized protein n=1 Tax=Ancylobacter tetraedralis TaxID=217068 RepID=A0A839ZEK5_9HYPH|nr:hypothetical protein [Ancylobacter tetraedralis]
MNISRLAIRAVTLLGGASLFLAAPAGAQETPPAPAAKVPSVIRNARYCEILPISLTTEGLKAVVYNTLGFDDCPADKWKAITEGDLRRQFDVFKIVMNGPRFFLMDKIAAFDATKAGEVISIGGIAMAKRAEVSLSIRQATEPAFTEQTIDRDTSYQFDAGKPVFQLTAPDGAVYVMQSYAQIVDPALTYDDLATLGPRLKLPAGWSYTTRTPDTDLMMVAHGKAIVIQDNFKNTYQKVVPN